MKRSAIQRKTPLRPGAGLKPKSATTKAPIRKSAMKSKQRAVTAAEKEYWSRLAGLGCIACMRMGIFEPDVSIHHVDGRTKPGCHMQVLALCASHHQEGTGKNPHYVAVHPWKARFEQMFGTQQELMSHSAVLAEWRK